jgi:hypothetical protein
MEYIRKIVEQIFDIDISTNSRQLKYVEARACYYKLCRKYTAYTYVQIGKTLNKNHATILHGVNEWPGMVRINPDLAEKYEIAKSKLFEHEPEMTPEKLLNQYNKLLLMNVLKSEKLNKIKKIINE